MQLTDLSSELILLILRHLTLSDIAILNLLNTEWNQFILLHESTIYRNCAILHGYVPAGQSLDDAKSITYGSDWLTTANSWKTFCHEWCSLNRRWDYRAQPKVTPHFVQDNPAHRIKIDEEDNFILSTSLFGGLDVRCAISFECLWRIPNRFVRRWAHLEYSNGFAVFDSYDSSHQVWVKTTRADQFREFSRPDPSQIQASEAAISNPEDPRGRFVPHLMLRNPVGTRAYRFVFPELLVASSQQRTAHIWNVVEGTIIEAYSLLEGLGPSPYPEEDANGNGAGHGSINYVELSPNHIFACFDTKLVVYQRVSFSDSERNKLPSGPPWREAVPVFVFPLYSSARRFSISPLGDDARPGTACPIMPLRSLPYRLRNIVPRASLSAVHVSPDGCNLVATTLDGDILLARNFANRPDSDKRRVWSIDVRSPIDNLAFDGTRVAFSADNSVFVFQIVSRPEAQDYEFPAKAIYRAYGFESMEDEISCMQLTRTSLWFVLRDRPDFEADIPQSGTHAIVHVDYANESEIIHDS